MMNISINKIENGYTVDIDYKSTYFKTKAQAIKFIKATILAAEFDEDLPDYNF